MTIKSFIRLSVFLPAIFCTLGQDLLSNPGDTTWVTVFNLRTLDYHGNFDTTAQFPTGLRYRKIRMHYILGRYACPGNPQYCGSWDYTTQLFLMPPAADTVEIARIITPYATDWLAKGIKHDYIVDVTDYAVLMDGMKSMRFFYDGYSWGFNLTLKFEMIEGVPPMDAMQVKNVYKGYFAYGSTTNPIENYLVPRTFSYAPNSPRVFVKNTVSGHGSDNTGCGEFCNKFYTLKLNGNNISQKQLWRSDCGMNQVYPQTGTWIFNRGNWCPGAVVWPIYHDLSSLTTANTNFTVDVDMQPYTVATASGGYNWQSQLVKYSAPNFSLDAAIEDIISPTKDENYIRNNPACSNPYIKIRNTGTDSVKSIAFNYGIEGKSPANYTWTGSLGFLQEEVVILPLSGAKMISATDKAFNVNIIKVNGVTDGNSFNNIYSSASKAVPKLPNDFVVKIFTNKSTKGGGFNETSWKLLDEGGLVVAERDTMHINVLYTDTVHLNYGCYQLVIDDAGCDGYDWWYYQYYNVNPGTGFMRLEYTDTGNSFYNFLGDFGCNRTYNFRLDSLPKLDDTGLASLEQRNAKVQVFPNPASDHAYLRIATGSEQQVVVRITDVDGRVMEERGLKKVKDVVETFDTGHLSSGLYFVTVLSDGQPAAVQKLLIQR